MKFSKVLVLATVMLFAGSAAARTVLQQQPQQPMPAAGQAMPPAGEGTPAPPQCQDTWEPDNISCTFTCPATGDWNFKCEAQSGAQGQPGGVASCNVNRKNAGANEATYFLCLVTAPNQPPNCQQGVAALNMIPDPCVTQNVNQIVGAWPAAPKQG